MHPSVNDAYQKIFRWAEQNPQATRLPGHIQRHYDLIERHEQATAPSFEQARDRFEIEQLRTDLENKVTEFTWRRELEHRLADYVHGVADITDTPSLHSIGNRLSSCRMSGTYGQRPDGGLIIAWDTKCGLVRLCPDESREETQRLDAFYNPAITEFAKADPRNRVFYSVFTSHNYRQSDLLRGKHELFNQFKAFIDKRIEYCPVTFVDGPACVIGKKPGQPITRTQEKYFPSIKGALVVQEDPLSARMDWNVHLNVIFLVQGRFDYKELRRLWDANIHFQEVGKDEQSVSAAVRELVKYSALIVAEKSEFKKDEALSADVGHELDQADTTTPPDSAPGMLDWPPSLWLQWWEAQQGFRRTRSYGCLYALYGKRWDAMTPGQRENVIRDASFPESDAKRHTRAYKHKPWAEVGKDFTKKKCEQVRVKLRRAMVHGEALDLNSIQWMGSVQWTGSSYWVDLIPGDNFSRQSRGNDNFSEYLDPGG